MQSLEEQREALSKQIKEVDLKIQIETVKGMLGQYYLLKGNGIFIYYKVLGLDETDGSVTVVGVSPLTYGVGAMIKLDNLYYPTGDVITKKEFDEVVSEYLFMLKELSEKQMNEMTILRIAYLKSTVMRLVNLYKNSQDEEEKEQLNIESMMLCTILQEIDPDAPDDPVPHISELI